MTSPCHNISRFNSNSLVIQASLPKGAPDFPSKVVPAVMIHSQPRELSPKTIQGYFDHFLNSDDVFQEQFTNNAFLVLPKSTKSRRHQTEEATPGRNSTEWLDKEDFSADLTNYLESKSLVLCVLEEELDIPEGPYFVVGKGLHQA
jgi:hypothetical protein